MLHSNGDIVVHKTFETRMKSVDLHKKLPIAEQTNVAYI